MHLKKKLTFLDVFSISTGTMISSGIFILPSLAFNRAGPAVVVSYFIAGVLALLGILSIIELSTALPKAGGDYFFISKSLGPLLGTISGLLSWFALSLKSAFAVFGISELIFLTLDFPIFYSSIIVVTFFVILNILGIKEAARFQVVFVIFLLLILISYIIFSSKSINYSFYNPFFQKGVKSVLYTVAFIFISFGGLLKVASISEEVKNPKKNIPLGIITSVICVTLIYTFIIFITVGILPSQELSNSLTPIADSANKIFGSFGYITISIAALIAFITTANAGIMAASRYPLALSRDKLIPSFLGRVEKKSKTPIVSIIMTGIFIVVALKFPLDLLVKSASVVILTAYVLTNLAVIILRESKLDNYQPSFRTPFYPWLQIFIILIFVFFIFFLGIEAIKVIIIFLILSSGVYFLYGRKKYLVEYALLHLIRRIADTTILEHLLESEFRDIIIERDEIEQDFFDTMIKSAIYLDLDKSINCNELFQLISESVSSKISIAENVIFEQLKNKQVKTNSAISKFVAIPHVVIEHSKVFTLIIIRCRSGIEITNKENSVKAVFALIGSNENPKLHLKILASIATIIHQKNFKSKWLDAKNINYLKDILLLSKRIRE